MKLLLTNDDGVSAVGLQVLMECLAPLGQLTVVAPETECSAIGRAITFTRPLRMRRVSENGRSLVVATDGTPTDCVLVALKHLLAEPPDFVVSGINSSPNMGHDIFYSGTVAAAMEGALNGIPSIAVSLGRGPDRDYRVAGEVAARLLDLLSERGLPPRTCLNVNVPGVPADRLAGFEVTRQGDTNYCQRVVGRVDPWGKEYLWVTGDVPTGEPLAGTDFGALHCNKVSITPLAMQLTDHHFVEVLSTWAI